MQPPWQEFPQIPLGSIGWRMGAGEDYARKFYAWFRAQGHDEQVQYAADNPEPQEWRGYYEEIATSG